MNDEVLVHVSTPATRQNDELFRQLAAAYTTFEHVQVHGIKSVRKKARTDQGLELDPDGHNQEQGTMREAPNSAVPTASKESYGSFPSNLSSEGYESDEGPVRASKSADRPISRLAQLDRSYLSWRKRITPKSSFKRTQSQNLRSSPDPDDADTGFIEDSQLAVQALQSQLLEICSSTSEDSSEIDDVPAASTDRIEEPPTEGASFVQSRQREPARELRLTVVKEIKASADLPVNSYEEPTDLLIRTNWLSQDRSYTGTAPFDLSAFPIDAFAPAPVISVACPGTLPSQITKHLAAIKIKNPDRFKPLYIRRSLERDERGYWLVECIHWSSKLQLDFWSLLCEHVGSGRVGWGTTVHRKTESDQTLGCVKLYCWGEVAEHMWLLLWLCSEGKVLGSGPRWIDANGVAILEMQ